MTILSIESIRCEDDLVYVTAVVENAIRIANATWFDPGEYGPALCEASFYTGDETVPENDEELIKWIEDIDPEWKVVDCSDYYD